jgi:Spy/CpxP family protein refolding chaperone
MSTRKNTLSIRRISLTFSVLLAFTFLLGIVYANSERTNTVVSHGRSFELKTTFEGTATSYTRRSNDPFSVGYYVKDGSIVAKNSLLADKDVKASDLDLDLVADGEAFSAVIAHGKGTDITLTGSITATDNGDGKLASDFSGIGAQIIASDYAKVRVDSMKIYTKGFLRAAFISDNHAQIYVKDTTVTAMGANPLTQAYKGYVNSADQDIMLSPPWVLGIQGGIRAGNMLGDRSTLTVVDSKITSGGWAVLSTDACSSPMMNVVDTTMEILPESKGGMSSGKFSCRNKYGSGYGTYFTGNAKENFYGVTFKGLTYAGIYTGGEGTYKSSKGKIELKDGEGNIIETVIGKGKPTVIDAVWGFMNHGSATVNVLDGTVVNAEEAVFLSKAGGASFIVDNAVLNPASGIILQMMDNDDRTVGGSMKAFNTEFKEAPGWPSESGNVTEKGAASAGGPGGPPGGGPGMGGVPQLTQQQQAAIEAMNETSAPLAQAVNEARNALNAAIYSDKPDTADIKAKAKKLATAELALAQARAEAFAELQASPNKLNLPSQQIIMLLGGSGRRFGGPGGFSGGPGGAPPGPPPDGRFGGPPGMPPGGSGPGGPGGPGGSSAVKLLLTNGSYKGNVFNGSGYYNQSGSPLEVTIGKAATLDGAISLTETRHIDETGKQNTDFTINEYYYLGHVANRNYRNGTGTIEVSLKDGGKWTVTGESLISKLVVDNGTVEGSNGAKVVMKIDGKETAIKKGETYSGNIAVLPVK